MPHYSRRTFYRPQLVSLEDRSVPAAWTPIPDGTLVISPDDGGIPKIHLADPVTGKEVHQIIGYEGSFRGGIHSELGDVTGDGTDDLVFAPGGGGGPRIKVVDGSTGEVIADFMVYEETFRGGVDVAVGDVNNDGFEDVMTGTGNSGGPRVRVLDGKSITEGSDPTVLYDFFPYEDTFRGGVKVGAGDMNADDFADIITGTGVGGGARVIVFDGQTGEVLQNFFAYDQSVRTGVRVGAGDLDGDGHDDILVGSGPGGGSHVRAVSGKDGRDLANFFADGNSHRGGVYVGGRDVNGDGVDEFVTETRHGNKQMVRAFDSHGNKLCDLVEDVDDAPGGG